MPDEDKELDGEKDQESKEQEEKETASSKRSKRSPEEEAERLRQELQETKSEAQLLRKKYKEEQKEKSVLENRWKESEEAKLKEEGKYKELYEKAEKEKQLTEQKLTESKEETNKHLIRAAIKGEARAAGLIDFDFLDKILLDDIHVTANGDVSGVEEAVAKYKESKPFLFKESEVKDEEKKTASGTRSTGASNTPPSPNTKTNTVDVRTMKPQDRKKALNTYMNSLKGMKLGA